MRIQIHGDAARLAQHFTIGVDPERDRAADLYPLSFISKQTFKAHMIPAISGREDPEEIQAVQVIGTEQIQFSVCIDSVRFPIRTLLRRTLSLELSASWHTAASNPMPALMLKSLTLPG